MLSDALLVFLLSGIYGIFLDCQLFLIEYKLNWYIHSKFFYFLEQNRLESQDQYE